MISLAHCSATRQDPAMTLSYYFSGLRCSLPSGGPSVSLSESCYQLPHFMIMKFGKWMSKLHSLMDIFKKKTEVDGNVTIYKDRLVVKDFRKVQGVDYDETFSPIAMLKSV